jgi:alkylation response protein AidB-like acyl-CoA dehydrogenase
MINSCYPSYKETCDTYRNIGTQLCAGVDMKDDDHHNFFDKNAWLKAGEFKLHGLTAHKSFGGPALHAVDMCAAFEGLGNGCVNNGLVFSICAHLVNGSHLLNTYGSDGQKQKYLEALASGNKILASAITEGRSGSDVFNMQATAVKQGDGYLLNAEKVYITNAPVADYLLVYCATKPGNNFFGGISAFIVPVVAKGVTISAAKDKMGLRTCTMGDVKLENVIVHEAEMIGKEGSGAIMFNNCMLWERIALGAMLVGQWQRVLDNTVQYAKTREAQDTKLIKLHNIAHRLAGAEINLQAARLLVQQAAMALHNKDKDVMLKVSCAKAFIAEQGVASIAGLQSVWGAAGYIQDNNIEREYRDFYASLVYSGTIDIHKNIIAGSL